MLRRLLAIDPARGGSVTTRKIYLEDWKHINSLFHSPPSAFCFGVENSLIILCPVVLLDWCAGLRLNMPRDRSKWGRWQFLDIPFSWTGWEAISKGVWQDDTRLPSIKLPPLHQTLVHQSARTNGRHHPHHLLGPLTEGVRVGGGLGIVNRIKENCRR